LEEDASLTHKDFLLETGYSSKQAAPRAAPSITMNLQKDMNGFYDMIVKLGEDPGFEDWTSKDRAVRAVKMTQDFLVETSLGFLPGKKGDYLVEMAPNVRFPCGEGAFLGAYRRIEIDAMDRRSGNDGRRRDDAKK
jgi:hypothetical protein